MPTKDTKLEDDLEAMIRELGYFPLKGIRVTIPASWTRFDHDIDLWPDLVVPIRFPFETRGLYSEFGRKVVLGDGWYWHSRTLRQEEDDAKKDEWYVRAGYYPVHVSSESVKTIERKEKLKPKLAAALVSREAVIHL